MLIKNGRLTLTIPLVEWIKKNESLPYVTFVPVNNSITRQSVELPGKFHKDPADRIIIATAQHLNMSIITKDDKIRNYPHVKPLW